MEEIGTFKEIKKRRKTGAVASFYNTLVYIYAPEEAKKYDYVKFFVDRENNRMLLRFCSETDGFKMLKVGERRRQLGTRQLGEFAGKKLRELQKVVKDDCVEVVGELV
ncbi:MAG: hypothetical protein N3A69_05705 [Leptospiraceae bacterium]|nr:hypothetical protein [Leptospiraceae bacterium]